LIGVQDKDKKYSPEQAEKLMHLKGTQEGFDQCPIPYMEPNEDNVRDFCFYEVLDSGQIKSYFGKKLHDLKNLTLKSMRLEGLQLHVGLAAGEEEGIDAVDDDDDIEVEVPAVNQDADAVYCVCHGVWGDRDMVECEQCSEWFHCDCVKFQLNKDPDLKTYVCETCTYTQQYHTYLLKHVSYSSFFKCLYTL
jgi:hypothetical protein